MANHVWRFVRWMVNAQKEVALAAAWHENYPPPPPHSILTEVNHQWGRNSHSGFRSMEIPKDDNAFGNMDSFSKTYQANEVGEATQRSAQESFDAGP